MIYSVHRFTEYLEWDGTLLSFSWKVNPKYTFTLLGRKSLCKMAKGVHFETQCFKQVYFLEHSNLLNRICLKLKYYKSDLQFWSTWDQKVFLLYYSCKYKSISHTYPVHPLEWGSFNNGLYKSDRWFEYLGTFCTFYLMVISRLSSLYL